MKNRVFGVVPLKKHSRRLPGKNFLEIDKIPLYERACNTLCNSDLDKVFLLTDTKQKYSEDGYKDLVHDLTGEDRDSVQMSQFD